MNKNEYLLNSFDEEMHYQYKPKKHKKEKGKKRKKNKNKPWKKTKNEVPEISLNVQKNRKKPLFKFNK